MSREYSTETLSQMRVTDFAGRLKILKDKHEEIERDREASEDT